MSRRSLVEILAAGVRDNNGDPLAAGKVYSYISGTTTHKPLYTTINGSTQVAQPGILDAYGRLTAYGEGLYKFLIKDSSDNTIFTMDYVNMSDTRSGTVDGGQSTGAANVYTLGSSPVTTAYDSSLLIRFLSHQTNTSSTVTGAIDSLTSKTIERADGRPLEIGDIRSGALHYLTYDEASGTLKLLNPYEGYISWSPTLGTQAGDLSAVTFNIAKFSRQGRYCEVDVHVTFTLATATTDYLTITAPSSPAIAGQVSGEYFGHGTYYDLTAIQDIFVHQLTTTQYFALQRPNGVDIAIGAAQTIRAKFKYPIA